MSEQKSNFTRIARPGSPVLDLSNGSLSSAAVVSYTPRRRDASPVIDVAVPDHLAGLRLTVEVPNITDVQTLERWATDVIHAAFQQMPSVNGPSVDCTAEAFPTAVVFTMTSVESADSPTRLNTVANFLEPYLVSVPFEGNGPVRIIKITRSPMNGK